MFCQWRPKNLVHEVLGTEFCLSYPEATFVRGIDVDEEILPDIEMRFANELFYVEIDTGSVPYRRQRTRWKKYDAFEGTVLVVCLTESRLKGLIATADGIEEKALFSTLSTIVGDPFGAVWRDVNGAMFSVEIQ